MDLTRAFPRSPYDMVAGLVMLPRTADKVRALQQGLLGEYIGRIYNDVRARPRYFIQRVVRQPETASQEEDRS